MWTTFFILEISVEIVFPFFLYLKLKLARCEFHQYFMHAFCANIFVPKNYKATALLEKSYAKHFCMKNVALKMLMKLTTALFSCFSHFSHTLQVAQFCKLRCPISVYKITKIVLKIPVFVIHNQSYLEHFPWMIRLNLRKQITQ